MKIAKITYTILLTAFIVFMAVGSGAGAKTPQEVEALTWEEYDELIEMYNYEIKKLGGKIKIKKGEDILNALNRNILERDVSKKEEMLRLHNKNFEAMPYKEHRKYLINKSQW